MLDHFETACMVAPTWLSMAYKIGDDREQIKDQVLSGFLDGIRDSINVDDYTELAKILHDVHVEYLGTLALIALVRFTCRFDTKIITWARFRDRVYFELLKRGLDAAQLLRGVIKVD